MGGGDVQTVESCVSFCCSSLVRMPPSAHLQNLLDNQECPKPMEKTKPKEPK